MKFISASAIAIAVALSNSVIATAIPPSDALVARGGDGKGGIGAFNNDAKLNDKVKELNAADFKKNNAVKDKAFNKNKVIALDQNKDKENALKNNNKN
ncbi:hypothetical protein CONPUDRAFT_137745, partial [Coniophora puteana RWD-64-598 SS2]